MYGAGLDGDDDDDPYAGPSAEIDSRHFAFDNGEEDEDIVVMGAESKEAPKKSQASSGNGDYWHDGRPVLVGFTLEVKGLPADKWCVSAGRCRLTTGGHFLISHQIGSLSPSKYGRKSSQKQSPPHRLEVYRENR